MSWYPPNLLSARVGFVSSAAVNTTTTGLVLAAPGAGFRIRLWAWRAGPDETTNAPAKWKVMISDGVAGTVKGEQSGSDFQSQPLQVFPGGLALTANTVVGRYVESSVASIEFAVDAYYTIEAA